MRVSLIKITNILGIKSAEIQPGAVTVIEGKNGDGKTSILDAIRSALGKGHDATLIRKGEESGEVVMVFDDGTTVTETVEPEGTKRKVEHPEMGKISKAQTYLDRLVGGALALNPIDFLTAESDRRLKIFLAGVPMKVTPDEIAQATGLPADQWTGPCAAEHALKVLELVEKAHFEQRTGVNRALKEKNGTVEQLSSTLGKPLDLAGGWKQRIHDLEGDQSSLSAQQLSAIDGASAAAGKLKAEAESRFTLEMERLNGDRQARLLGLDAEERREIEAINARFTERRQSLAAEITANGSQARVTRDAAIKAADEALSKAKEEAALAFDEALRQVAEDLGHAKAMHDQEIKDGATRELVERMKAEAAKLDAEARKLTTAIEGIRTMRTNLTANLPIAGVEIRDGEILVEGIPFDRVNEAKRIKLAIEIAKLGVGKLGLLCVDGMERLDSEGFTEFSKQAEASGLQLIVARVSDSPLSVRQAA